MKYSIVSKGNTASVLLSGKLYVSDASQLRDDSIRIMSKGVVNIRMDVSGLTYIDSSGLGTIISIHKRTIDKNGALTLIGCQGMPLDLIKRTRLDKVFNME